MVYTEYYAYINITHGYKVPFTKHSILKSSGSNSRELAVSFGSYQKSPFCRIYKKKLIIQLWCSFERIVKTWVRLEVIIYIITAKRQIIFFRWIWNIKSHHELVTAQRWRIIHKNVNNVKKICALVENNKEICSYWHHSRVKSFAITHSNISCFYHKCLKVLLKTCECSCKSQLWRTWTPFIYTRASNRGPFVYFRNLY